MNLLANKNRKKVNLLADMRNKQPQQEQDFYNLSPEDQEKVLGMAKQNISQEHPNMPDWLRDALISMAPKNKSPWLEANGRSIRAENNTLDSMKGGLLQGASIPIRGVAGLLNPGVNKLMQGLDEPARQLDELSGVPHQPPSQDFLKRLAESHDLQNLFPKPQGNPQKAAQLGAELLGGGGAFGKLLQGTGQLAKLAQLPKKLQGATALGSAGAIATPGGAEERALGAGGALALGGAGKLAQKAASKLSPFVRGLFNESSPEALIEAVQKPHDVLERGANELYGQVRSAIGKRDIKTPIKEELLDKIKSFPSMDSDTHRELIEAAKKGDYEAIHKLQSSLFQKGTKDIANSDSVVETRGENMLKLRNDINSDLEDQLIQQGHLDIAHVLKQGKKLYSDLQKTYYDKLLPKGIGKLVHQETRLIPENPENLFKQNSKPMSKFLQRHPEVAKHAKGIKEKEKAKKELNRILITSGATGGSIAGGKAFYDLFH